MGSYTVTEGKHPKSYDALGSRLRAIDKLEIRAVSGSPPPDALRRALQTSSKWFLIEWDGEDQGLFGVAPTDMSGVGSPWFLSTDKVFRVPEMRRAFILQSPEYLRELCAGYDLLFNVISEHNHPSKRWLKHIGFTIDDKAQHFFKGLCFQEFMYVVPGGKYDV